MPAHEILYAGVLEAQLIKKVDLMVISKVILNQCFYMDILPRLSARLPLYIATGDRPKWAPRVKFLREVLWKTHHLSNHVDKKLAEASTLEGRLNTDKQKMPCLYSRLRTIWI